MKKRTKRLLGSIALVVGGVGAATAYITRKKSMAMNSRRQRQDKPNTWARPGMRVTFRAELMPGRDREERTFRVTKLLPSARVLLDGVVGEHAEKEFEPFR